MLKHPDITRRRIERFVADLQPSLFSARSPLRAEVFRLAREQRDYRDLRIDPQAATGFEYQPVDIGFAWGPIWTDAWFRFTGAVPREWARSRVVALLDTGTESIVWDGARPLQGVDRNHKELLLHERATGGELVTLTVQANGMNPFTSGHRRPPEPPAAPFVFKQADLAVVDVELTALYFDMKVALGVMKEQPADSPRYGELLYALNEAINLYDGEQRETIAIARKRLAETFDRPASASAHRISATGHSHIDTAWLWPLERTEYKCIHTWATATRLMDQYPDYRFVCSQAAQYAWVKQLCPPLYARIHEKVKAGQWEPTGSMWVEADCNLSSGESLVRQIVHGKRFFKEEFGIDTRDLWLPDVFGYSAALPQILKRAGIDRFLTQKISWNQMNRFPHHTFLWQGIDGTQIFSHFPPADTYTAEMTTKELCFSVRNFGEHGWASRSLYLFGFGDGGGGPTAEMLETARRLRSVEGMPVVEMEKTADFFRKAMEDAHDLPVWAGELYLELHRGTYTTHAANKRGNRKSELLLRDAEFLSVVSAAGLGAYPAARLDSLWKTVLLNQFHDIIPGSSVTEVYRDSDRDYEEIARQGGSIVSEAQDALAQAIETTGMRRPVMVVSNLSHFASEAVEVPIRADEQPGAAIGPEGDVAAVQINTAQDGARTALFVAKNLPLHGYSVWDLGATYIADEAGEGVSVTETSLESDSLRVELDPRTGLICRIFDKDREREVLNDTFEYDADGRRGALLPDRCANQLQLFEDVPLGDDAWNLEAYYAEKMRIVTELDRIEVVERGPVRGALSIVRSFGSSTLTQTIRLTAGSARIDFVTEVEWRETDRALKAAFPVAVNSPRATYEIQFGHVERPTHYNTSWDVARFEVCAQRWVDLGEGDYGVALLNDCKYGCDVHGDTLRLTLLRSPKAPDPEADMGHHMFTYSLLPHGGDFRDGEVIEQAAALNSPPSVRPLPSNQSGPLPAERSFFSVDNAAVFIEAIKRAETEQAIIVRMYEAHNTRGEVVLTTTLPVRRAHLCDLMENNVAEVRVSGGEMTLPVQPFEIITIKLLL